MKKIAIFSLALILMNGRTEAQYAKSSLPLQGGITMHSSRSSSVENDFTPNTRAGKNFARKYGQATNVRWSGLHDGGLLVHFYVDGIQTKIFYDRKGRETGRVRYYSAAELPADVRHQVRSTYYEYDIFLVTEVSVGNKVVYLVKIKNTACTKTINVANGEMAVVEEIDDL